MWGEFGVKERNFVWTSRDECLGLCVPSEDPYVQEIGGHLPTYQY